MGKSDNQETMEINLISSTGYPVPMESHQWIRRLVDIDMVRDIALYN